MTTLWKSIWTLLTNQSLFSIAPVLMTRNPIRLCCENLEASTEYSLAPITAPKTASTKNHRRLVGALRWIHLFQTNPQHLALRLGSDSPLRPNNFWAKIPSRQYRYRRPKRTRALKFMRTQ